MAESISEKILLRMVRHRWIGGKHTDIQNLRKGFERSRYGEIEEEISRLVKEGFIMPKPAFYGMHVSLNPAMLAEVKRLLKL